jgi:hypothetical protein
VKRAYDAAYDRSPSGYLKANYSMLRRYFISVTLNDYTRPSSTIHSSSFLYIYIFDLRQSYSRASYRITQIVAMQNLSDAADSSFLPQTPNTPPPTMLSTMRGVP